MKPMTEYYASKLEQGLRFQDCVTDWLYDHGMVIVTYVSKARGMSAENRFGVEIKRDDRFRETGNLFIETAEKSHPDNPQYVASGIYREDNSWLYAIGDEKTLWIFAKRLLTMLDKRYERREIPTARGYIMPTIDGDKYCAKKLERP